MKKTIEKLKKVQDIVMFVLTDKRYNADLDRNEVNFIKQNESSFLFYTIVNDTFFPFFRKIKDLIEFDYKTRIIFSWYEKWINEFDNELVKVTKIIKRTKAGIIKLKETRKLHTDIDIACPRELNKVIENFLNYGYTLKDKIYDNNYSLRREKSRITIEIHKKRLISNISKLPILDFSKIKFHSKKFFENIKVKYPVPEWDIIIWIFHQFLTVNTTPQLRGYFTLSLSDILTLRKLKVKNIYKKIERMGKDKCINIINFDIDLAIKIIKYVIENFERRKIVLPYLIPTNIIIKNIINYSIPYGVIFLQTLTLKNILRILHKKSPIIKYKEFYPYRFIYV